MEIGVRRFREQLSHWLALVRGGQEIVLTERGKPVARIVGVSEAGSIDRLVAAGIITPPVRPKSASATRPKLRIRGSVSDLVKEQRR